MIFAELTIEGWIFLVGLFGMLGFIAVVCAVQWLTTRTIYRGPARAIIAGFPKPGVGMPGADTCIKIDVPGIGILHHVVPQSNCYYLEEIAPEHDVEVELKGYWLFGTNREFTLIRFPGIGKVWRGWWLEDDWCQGDRPESKTA